MNGSVAKKTQDTLGKVIKKPPLTEKLLNKPPFRYLHDIFSEVIRTTGFMKGLYGENEMKSDNVKDKDAKMEFLQKAIDVVMLVSGEPLAAKPARVVAGHEPERTNELLQAMARCCLNKLSSDEAVKRVLAGDKGDLKGKAITPKSQDKENREGRERHKDREERREISEQKDPEQPKDQESHRGDKERQRDGERSDKPRERDRTKDRHKDKSRDRDKDKEKCKDQEREREKGKDKEKEREREKDKEKERDRERGKDREKTKDRDSHRDRGRERDREREKRGDQEKERERSKEGDDRTRAADRGNRKVRASEERRPKPHPEEPSQTAKPEPSSDSPARIPRPSSAKGQRRRPKAGGQDESDSEGDGDTPLAERPFPLENGDCTDTGPPHTAARRLTRPSSARTAPPRVKRQESYTDVTPAERMSSAKPQAPVIMEGRKLSDNDEDDDEQFVVEEAGPPLPDMPRMEVEPTVELDGDEKHGGLVKKILDTKKDFESSPLSSKSKDQTQSLVSDAARKQERDAVSREIERLRSSIQTVCRSALPLGKIMDYIQEDMDAMQNELQTWRRENKEHGQALLQEQRVTDDAVEPLKAELFELDQLIKEQQDKICAVKSNILKGEEKIQKMVSSINFSSRP